MNGLPEETVELIARALAEDLGSGDVTAAATVPAEAKAEARIVRKEAGVVSGLAVAREVFRQVGVTDIEEMAPEGEWRDDVPGEILRLRGPARAMLAGERVALNFLGHLSGVATLTARYVEAVAGSATRILDTRKTTPGLRALEKAAVTDGGGVNHRFGLFDAVLIKENHIAMAGGVEQAIRSCRETSPHLKIEIETETLREVEEAVALRPDRIMLDNMDNRTLTAAVALRDREDLGIELEASGGVDLQTVAGIAATGVDFISVGALTHSAPQLDLSMLIQPVTAVRESRRPAG